MKYINITGRKFNRLTAVEYLGNSIWSCLCECGKYSKVSGNRLTSGKIKSCGCYRNDVNTKRGKGKLTICNIGYNNLLTNAKARGIEVTLTKEQIFEIVVQPCFYCGSRDERINPRTKEKYFIVGVDRLDSSLGYETNNVVPCCSKCNYAKRDLEVNEFLSWINRVYENQQKISLTTNNAF